VAQPRSQDWPNKEEFTRRVSFAVQLFELDPELPEIKQLKDDYDMLSTPHPGNLSPMDYLRRLNPNYTVYVRPDGEVFVAEDPAGSRILGVASIIRHHLKDLDQRLEEVAVDYRGLHLYGEPGMSRLATVGGLHIDPHRLADPGNRHERACQLIREFTGVELQWRPLVRHTRSILVTRDHDRSNWRVKIVPPPGS
jgi:hypothetical protein